MIYIYDFRWKWINHAKIIKLFLYNEETNDGFDTANANIEEFGQTKTMSPTSRRYKGIFQLDNRGQGLKENCCWQ